MGSYEAYPEITYIKVSNGVETTIGTARGNEISHTGGTATYSRETMMCVKFDTSLCHFKKGDILRVNVKIYGKGGNGAVYMGHDPKNRYDDAGYMLLTDNSQFICYIPVVVDL